MLYRTIDHFVAGVLGSAHAEVKRQHAYGDPGREAAVALARAFSGSALPLEFLAEWLRRNPEAADAVLNRLNRTEATEAVRAPSARHADEFTAEGRERDAAQKSESAPVPGVKGAEAAPKSVTVNSANAGELAGRIFTTREVKPRDIADVIAEAPVMTGQAVMDASGPVRVKARFANGERLVEFMDKRGPILLMRVIGSDGIGREIVNGPLIAVEPGERERVQALFAGKPGADDEFNFDPYEGMPDPWLPSNCTTVDG